MPSPEINHSANIATAGSIELTTRPQPAVLAPESPVSPEEIAALEMPDPAMQETHEQEPHETTTQASNRFMEFFNNVSYSLKYPFNEWPHTTRIAAANSLIGLSILCMDNINKYPNSGSSILGIIKGVSFSGLAYGFGVSTWYAIKVDNGNSRLRLNERLQQGGTNQTSNNYVRDYWRTAGTGIAYTAFIASEKYALDKFNNNEIGKGAGLQYLAISGAFSGISMALTAEMERRKLERGVRHASEQV